MPLLFMVVDCQCPAVIMVNLVTNFEPGFRGFGDCSTFDVENMDSQTLVCVCVLVKSELFVMDLKVKLIG